MATNFFIKFETPAIDGESNVKGQEKTIQVLSWSHSFNQPTSPTRSSAGGGTVEQANHSDFSFTKYMDLATVLLIKNNWNGKTIAKATFTAYRSDGDDDAVKYLEIVMENVVISNVSLGGGTGDMATENITLAYSKVQYTYVQQKNADGTKGGNVVASHDLNLQSVA